MEVCFRSGFDVDQRGRKMRGKRGRNEKEVSNRREKDGKRSEAFNEYNKMTYEDTEKSLLSVGK
jgi:hypothetical protein